MWYARLAAYGSSLAKGSTFKREGAVPDCYRLLVGHIRASPIPVLVYDTVPVFQLLIKELLHSLRSEDMWKISPKERLDTRKTSGTVQARWAYTLGDGPPCMLPPNTATAAAAAAAAIARTWSP